ncbi:hypothetical protein AQUCO_00201331v1 [Aquilegia coerulea]|uniref:DC1 domain-containing protein n=1 Tax=Aquilegia coerulea TaxID=218851 RepID=A0A2G5F7G3_AQUCA|nr:hypothetical protein AQUCO_00201331v1 [Aquilegia coerulea]
MIHAYIQHFSHEHPLEFFHFQDQALNLVLCSGCKLKPSKWIYICKACNYIIHIPCSKKPQLIHHPADPNHDLILLSQAAYPQGMFNSDACGHPGDGFCYHCSSCQIDLHILCASMPLSLTHHAHPHPLNLMFDSPYQTKKFYCDMPEDCANGRLSPVHQFQMSRPQTLLHYNSFPVANHHQFQQFGSTSHRPDYYINDPNDPNHHQFQQFGSTSHQPDYYVNDPKQAVQPTKSNMGIGHAATQGLVEGVAQQVAQNAVQSIVGGNDGGIGADVFTSVLGNLL